MFGWMLYRGATYEALSKEARRAIWSRFSLGALAYLVAIAVAFVSAPAALAIIGLVAVYYVVERTPSFAESSSSAEGGDQAQ
jgi:hypothetical protein